MVVGISGKMGSGKDLVYNMLCELSDVNFENKKFAYPIKKIVSILLGCDLDQLEDREFKEKPLGEDWIVHWYKDNKGRKSLTKTALEAVNHPDAATTGQDMLTPRLLLQLLGTEAGREIIHPNIWVNALFADYKVTNDCSQHSDGLWYTSEHGEEESEVTPVYPNWIITDVRFPNEAKAIKDKGGILIRIERPGIESHCGKQHLSETSLDAYDKFDYVIENDGTVQDLIDKVMALNIV